MKNMFENILDQRFEEAVGKYHPSHMGESGGHCVSCAFMDSARDFVKKEIQASKEGVLRKETRIILETIWLAVTVLLLSSGHIYWTVFSTFMFWLTAFFN